MAESHFHIQITAVLEVLMKTAVSDICALMDSWVQSFQQEIRISQQENSDLKQRLYIIQQQQQLQQQQQQLQQQQSSPSKTQRRTESTKPEKSASASELRTDTKKKKENSEAVASKRGQWCVMLQKWNPTPEETKAEMMDRSIHEREEDKLNAASQDVDYVSACPDPGANHAVYKLKTESEKVQPDVQENEYCSGVRAECENEDDHNNEEEEEEEPAGWEEEEQNQDLRAQLNSRPKREEEDQFEISCLLTPDLQLHSSHLLKEIQSRESSTFPVPSLNFEEFSLSSAAQRFSERTSASSVCKKQMEASFICSICGKALTTKRSYICHLRLHTGEKPFICTQCGKSFAKKFNLDIHYNVHSGARPYACTLCPRSFADPSAFGRHKLVHRKKSQQDPFTPKCTFNCNVCGHSFSSKYALAIHFKSHAAEKPYVMQNVLY